MTDYDHGWLDGYSTGFLDGSASTESDTIEGQGSTNPGVEDESHNDPSTSDDASQPAASITSRTVYGVRGPWGQVYPRFQ